MTIFNVTYDLNKKGQNYNALYEEIKKTDHLHYLDSNWFIDTTEAAEAASARFRKHLDSNDNILVIKVTAPYQGWLPQDAWTWMQKKIR